MENGCQKILSEVDGFVFDVDGTIINLAVDWVGLKRYLKIEFKIGKQIHSLNEIVNEIKKKHGADLATPVIREYELEATKKAEPNDVCINLIKTIYAKGIRQAIFSANTRSAVEECLKKFNITNCFDKIVCKEDVREQKPNAEGLKKIINYYKSSKLCYVGDCKDEPIAKSMHIRFVNVNSL